MKLSRPDRITELTKERLRGINEEISNQYKDTRPYRMEKETPTQMINNYLQLDERVKAQLRQIPAWQQKEQQILKMMEEKNG